MSKLKPMGAFVLLQKDPDLEVVSGHGIIIRPGVVYATLVWATVIRLGPLCGRFGVVEGDRVLVHNSIGSMVKEDGEEYQIVREVDLWAKEGVDGAIDPFYN